MKSQLRNAHKTNAAVTNELMMIPDMNSNFRKNRMSNARIQQLVTLLYMHKTMVESDGIIQSESEELQKIIKRIDRNYGYYSTNPMILLYVYIWYHIREVFNFIGEFGGAICLNHQIRN